MRDRPVVPFGIMMDFPGPDASRVLAAVEELRRAQSDGRLDAICDGHDVEVLTLHGSAGRGEPDPRDVDVAVRFVSDDHDLVALQLALSDLVSLDVDLMDTHRASVTARARAFGHGATPLFESSPGAFARAQMAALGLEMDFAPLRRRQLETMAERDDE